MISITSDVSLRPIRMILEDKKLKIKRPMVNSMCVYHFNTMKYINRSFSDVEREVNQYSSMISQLFPYYMHSTVPKQSLAIQISMQAIGYSVVKGNATIISTDIKEPVIKTDLLNFIRLYMTNNSIDNRLELSARPVGTVFVKSKMNIKDTYYIIKEFA